MLVPVSSRLFNRPRDLLPGLEPTALQRQRLQYLPPRLDQVEDIQNLIKCFSDQVSQN
jgi:hypothetical protein